MTVNVMQGNLLDARVDALVNTVNCVGIMGKGIALQFKRRYPKMYVEYRRACQLGMVHVGSMHIFRVDELSGPAFVINFPTKKHWKGSSSLEWVQAGLEDLVGCVQRLKIKSIAIPPLGVGNGGLAWADVEPLIRAAFDDVEVTVELFPPSASGSRPVDRPSKLTISPSRALVLQLMIGYASKRNEFDPWDQPQGVSHLEIQKLMYFANVLNPNLKLDFEQGHFGPYSDKVRHIIQDMEGQFTAGFGDGSAKALTLEPIRITEQGERALYQYLRSEQGQHVTNLSRRVLTITDGYEDAYGLELLASTFMMGEGTNRDVDRIAQRVRGWNRRKGLIYTDGHIAGAVQHLQKAGV